MNFNQQREQRSLLCHVAYCTDDPTFRLSQVDVLSSIRPDRQSAGSATAFSRALIGLEKILRHALLLCCGEGVNAVKGTGNYKGASRLKTSLTIFLFFLFHSPCSKSPHPSIPPSLPPSPPSLIPCLLINQIPKRPTLDKAPAVLREKSHGLIKESRGHVHVVRGEKHVRQAPEGGVGRKGF